MSTHTQLLRRWTLGLSSVFVAMAAVMLYLLWQDRQLASSPATGGHAQATALRIKRNGFPDIVLSKAGTGWNIDEPCTAAANFQRLEPLLGALQPGALQYAADEVDREAAGLLTPEATVYIDDVEYRIGSTDLQGERRYVQHDEVVEFAPEWVLSLINGGLTAFAEPTVFTQPLTSLQVTDESGDTQTITENPELQAWQSLSAQQIVIWPLPNETVEAVDAGQLLASSVGQATETLTIYNTDKLTALHAGDDSCAYILPPDSLPTP